MSGNCRNCGTKFTFLGNSSSAGNGLCVKCDGERYQRALLEEAGRIDENDPALLAEKAMSAALAAILVTTETILPDLEVAQRHGIVGADVAFGAGPLKDIAVSLSNAFGGRSDTMRKLMADTRTLALEELRREAHALGANALIGVSFTITSIGLNGTMTLMCATGTAVTVKSRG